MTITVKDAMMSAAMLVGCGEEVKKALEGEGSEEGKRVAELLLQCFQRVENELALDYLPLLEEEELVTATGLIAYADLKKSAVRILCVEDEWGNSLKYKLFPTYLRTAAGKVKLVYAYTPEKKSTSGVSDYQTEASERLLSYGMAAEYSLVVGDLTAAGAWDKKYKEGVQAAYRIHPCKRLRSRRWA